MDNFGKSQSVTRREDQRLVTGHGRYVDDIAPADALFAGFVRSQVGHAKLGSVDVQDAAAMPGVVAVLTAADMLAMGASLGMDYTRVPTLDGGKGTAPERPFLAHDRVRFVGEPVAVVLAETQAQAIEAAEAVIVDYDELPAHMDLATGGEALHDEAPDNLAFDYGKGDEAGCARAFRDAAHTVKLKIEDNRIMVSSMEGRGCWAEWAEDRLHVCFSGQGVWGLKSELVNRFGLDPSQVRATTPDVGGGFGMKGFNYPEYFAVAGAAMKLGRPVRWMSDRTEAMLSDNGGRDLVHVAELAFDENLKITAYRVENTCNIGAYNSMFAQMIQTELFSRVLMGTYDVQTTWLRTRGIYTNTAPVDAYRGAGRPEAIFTLERILSRSARELGVDPHELRRRNFIKADQFPYVSATGETYDVGDFHATLAKGEALADMAGFAARKSDSAARGKLRGIGTCYYIESILGAPDEHVKIAFNDDGTASIFVGTQSNGQGHETVFPQFLSDHTGIPVDKIAFVQGDSDLIASGGGTGGSRSVTVQNNVTLKAARAMIDDFAAFLADELGAKPDDVSFDDERFRVEGSNETPTMLDVAAMARAAGRTDLLTRTAHEKLPGRSYPNGVHIAEVEIDPETGETEVVKYTVCDDFGNLINPMLAEGQVHGGVVQGIGQAIQERVVYDEHGQLLTASYMDYGVPRAVDVPMFRFDTNPVPSTANPMGMKGCGEAGTVGALAAVSNAVEDALWERGVRQVDLPFTPARVWDLLTAESHAHAAE
ncbi:xanthine dehydrogenase family protein molybdopterin-binding subunit [Maribius pontilimi]|uniref:Xanthine dehydrogenase family protein molybdopterin-binding subunit n=1 Tax=Palleronia pontilimi TaxID=1964209 RepID=A0A934MBS2_9RHOB|nr:xanthine dehydrogenase family protein molybdopterin-binding subunit [Palleronia pontilimi]MBJ3761805.1 xanthine dehydrogenase family protein molybdopterin-binding subunit [Palleronia pontilimi]